MVITGRPRSATRYDTTLLLHRDHPAVIRDLADVQAMHRTVSTLLAAPRRDAEALWAVSDDGDEAVTLAIRTAAPLGPVVMPDGVLGMVRFRVAPIDVTTGDRFAFTLIANPTIKRDGKRHAVDPAGWLSRRAERHGFRVETVTMRDDIVHGQRDRARLTFARTRYAGVLVVGEGDRFAEALRSGIGPAKGYGFGLLQIAWV